MTKDFTKPSKSDNQNAWSNNAGRLVKFVVANLINRDDVYGIESPKGKDGAA